MKIGNNVTNPGKMRTQVSIQTRGVVQDDGGFMVDGWTTTATVWCKWANVHGSEVWDAVKVNAEAPATVLMRYRSDVDPTCALLKGAQRYEVVSVDNIEERGEYLELKVKLMKAG